MEGRTRARSILGVAAVVAVLIVFQCLRPSAGDRAGAPETLPGLADRSRPASPPLPLPQPLPQQRPALPSAASEAVEPAPEPEEIAVRCPVRTDRAVPRRHDGLEWHLDGPYAENAVVTIERRVSEEVRHAVAVLAHIDEERLDFAAPPGFEAAWLSVDGFQSVAFTWTAEGCPVVTLQPAAVITGTVTPAFNAPWVVGCGAPGQLGGDAHVDAQGRFRLDAVPGDCHVRALRLDGQLVVSSPWVPISPTVDAPAEVHLELPPLEQGIIGLWLEEAPGGLAVRRVLPGLPAERAGLEVHDLVTAVDGRSAEDMTHDAWLEAVRGPVGEPLTLEVETPSGTRTLALERVLDAFDP